MKKAKEYTFKKKGTVLDLIVGIILLGGICMILPILLVSPLGFLFAAPVPIVMAYFHFYGILITNQFNKFDYDKHIIIEADRVSLTITQSSKSIFIKSDDVISIDICKGKDIGKFTNLDYIVLHTINHGEIIITELTIPGLAFDNILQSFLRKKPRTYFKKNRNFIKGQPIL